MGKTFSPQYSQLDLLHCSMLVTINVINSVSIYYNNLNKLVQRWDEIINYFWERSVDNWNFQGLKIWEDVRSVQPQLSTTIAFLRAGYDVEKVSLPRSCVQFREVPWQPLKRAAFGIKGHSRAGQWPYRLKLLRPILVLISMLGRGNLGDSRRLRCVKLRN